MMFVLDLHINMLKSYGCNWGGFFTILTTPFLDTEYNINTAF